MVFGDEFIVTYPCIQIDNIVCDNIKVSSKIDDNKYLLSVGFCRTSGIEGMLISEVRQRRGNVPCRLESSTLYKNRCTATISRDHRTYQNYEVTVRQPRFSPQKYIRIKTGSGNSIESLLHLSPTFHAVCDITFNDVSLNKRYVNKLPMMAISYESITVKVKSDLWNYMYNPPGVYDGREANDTDANAIADFNKWRLNN